jgi:hypothetical protein
VGDPLQVSMQRLAQARQRGDADDIALHARTTCFRAARARSRRHGEATVACCN